MASCSPGLLVWGPSHCKPHPWPPKDQRDLITPECHLCIPEGQWYTRWKVLIKTGGKGFPGGAVVGSLPANAGNTGSSPGLGGSHMSQSDWAREPQLLSLCAWSLCSAIREAAMVRGPRTAMKSGPCLPQLEKALARKRRPNTAINK